MKKNFFFLNQNFNISFSKLLLIFILSILVLHTPEVSYAAKARPRIVSRKLSVGQKVRVYGNRCNLSLKKSTVKAIRISCGGNRKGSARAGNPNIVLRKSDSANFSANRCFLTISSISASKIDVKCLKNPPTATPTPSPTVTPTATITFTATPTPTSTLTPNSNVLFNNNSMSDLNTSDISTLSAPASFTGVNAGDVIVSIDRRPKNGFLYGIGYNAVAGTIQLYKISSDNGTATPIGTAGTFVDGSASPVMIGSGTSTTFGMDFNPAADRIRVVNSIAQNFRINPNTGAFVDGDLGGPTGSVSGVNMDGAINGATTSVDGSAYTNNLLSTAVTTVYTISSATDEICIQSPPNTGTQTSCNTLSSAVDSVRGFDIASDVTVASSNTPVTSGLAFSILNLTGTSNYVLSSINLINGALNTIGQISATDQSLGLALQQQPSIPVAALDATGTQLIRFYLATPGTTSIVGITGVFAGETLVGIDYRPSTGQLYGLGINATANTGTLYIIDPHTGAATVIGLNSIIAFVNSMAVAIDFPTTSTGYGFDFNPTADRIRVLAGNGLNFRINPNNGSPIDGDALSIGTQPDGNINGLITGAQAAAYTNSSGGQTVTTLYVIDAFSDGLYIQNPPNTGVETNFIPLTINGSTLDLSSVNGFDIPSNVKTTSSSAPVTQGVGYLAATVGGVGHLYTVDLTNGNCTDLGTTLSLLSGLTVGDATVK